VTENNFEETATIAPDFVEYDDTDYEESTRTPLLAQGLMLAEIVRGTRGVVKSGNLQVSFTLAPVNGEGDVVRGVTTKHNLYPSIRNPGKPGHRAPRTVFFNWLFAKALGEDLPWRPTKVSKGVYADQDGEVMSGPAASAQYELVDRAAGKISAGWYNNPDAEVGKRMYINVIHVLSDDGTRTFANVDKVFSLNELPDGELITDGFEVSAPPIG
jgi:hypothetical protein